MTDPNILDQLFNAVVSEREAKRMIAEKAKSLVQEAVIFRLPTDAARRGVRKELTVWINQKSLTGRGTKKLVDKAVAKAMRGYKKSKAAREEELDGRSFDDKTIPLMGGWADKVDGKRKWEPKVSEWRGKRAASAFAQKRK